MATKENPRALSAYEIVDVIERLLESHAYLEMRLEARYLDRLRREAEGVICKLVGPERESEARWSTKHIRVDEDYARLLADSLSVSFEEAHDWFIGEPVKRAEPVAAWALEKADTRILENGAIHGDRSRIVAEILQKWATDNKTGVYRSAARQVLKTNG